MKLSIAAVLFSVSISAMGFTGRDIDARIEIRDNEGRTIQFRQFVGPYKQQIPVTSGETVMGMAESDSLFTSPVVFVEILWLPANGVYGLLNGDAVQAFDTIPSMGSFYFKVPGRGTVWIFSSEQIITRVSDVTD